ncbi:YxlC family protein [Lysinibacillus sphaericus]
MNNKQHPIEENQLEKILKAGMEPLDKEAEDNIPSEEWFRQFVLQQQKDVKARLKRDLILFLLIAGCLLLLLSLTLVKMPVLFLMMQGAVFIGGATFAGLAFFKQVKKI